MCEAWSTTCWRSPSFERGKSAPAPALDGVDKLPSADILLYARSPLSSRGLFLVTEESASSMEFRGGGLSPSEAARFGVRDMPSEDDSITLYLLYALYVRLKDGPAERAR